MTLTDRQTGKVLFSRPASNSASATRSRSIPQPYFDESGTAMERLSRDVARSRGERHPGELLDDARAIPGAHQEETLRRRPTCCWAPKPTSGGASRRRCSATVPAGRGHQHDLAEVALAEVVDDARALSLFASERLIWVVNAEAALPKGRAADGGRRWRRRRGAGDAGAADRLSEGPDSRRGAGLRGDRFDFEGDDKRKQDRVRKFYAAIPDVVELRRYSPHGCARARRSRWSARAGFRIDPAALELLVEALGADIARIAVEIEKLSLYRGRPGDRRGRYRRAGAGRARHHDFRAGGRARPARPRAGARRSWTR